ncbi:MAG: cation:proton antiporter [Deltaproteobacteria bacterium]|nr:cation:proton antiporter [Deltaproteobacteria bacterium]MBW1921591.1 cation:proton antiporter [Deltaproteobacteria bacterium]MBW1933381.1 cation:proton antiporter [Deltaproteobacteria bacterium]MBW1979371.1 cation:proton antiporter [Deltaproteobacteria bacterium]MBW2046516.1 cation:proton antiporter [Deltaproteobacteria bacterium]
MEIPLLTDIVIIFGLSIGILFICHRLRVPTIVGFLLAGILAGPYGLGLVKAVHEVEILAEIGVVLLLFTIGIEFSLQRLLQIKKSVLTGGSIQVLLTFFVAFVIARQLGQPVGNSIFIGFLISLSSTAIVLKLLQERGEVDSPHGRTALGILIFQDIIIVPMILVTPLLAGATGNAGESVLVLIAKGIGIIGLVIVSTKWIVPRVLYQIARTRSQELFLLSIIVICLAVAWATSSAGLSLALGAFLAGLIISESEYSHQALGNILPFRDVFTPFFFVSIGMLLDVGFLFRQPGSIALIALSVLVLKSIIACFATVLLGFPFRTSILVGLALSQVGEFSFILSKTGVEHGLLAGNIHQMFLAFSILSMAATPFIIALAPPLADTILRLPVPKRLVLGIYPISETKVVDRKDHVIIIGFGVNGRNVARAARFAGIPYAIIEMNPATVRSEQAKGEPIYYGDATQETVLQKANIKNARIVVVAINDPTATRRITEVVRRISPKVHLIVRTRYLQEMKPLYELGASEVIPEEFETSIEIFTRVLTKYLIPRDEIERLLAEVRADGYEMFRSISKASASLSDLKLQLHDVDMSTFRIAQGSPLIGKTLAQIELRRRYSVSVVAIRRDSQILSNPGADTVLHSNDVLFVLGSSQKISEAINTFSSSNKGDERS